MYKSRSSRKIDSQRIFSREYDFPEYLYLSENQFSRKTYFYTVASRLVKCTSLIWVLLFPVTSVFRGCPELKGSVQKLSLSFLAFGNGERGTRQLQIGSEIRGKMANNPMRDGQPGYEVPRAEKRVKI